VIFELAIVKPKPLRMNLNWPHCVITHDQRGPSCPWCTSNSLCFPPALARVSRSIRHDTLKIFYGQNKFKLSLKYIDNVGLVKWLRNVGTEYRCLVKMRITAQMRGRGKRTFVEDTMAMLKKAGWETVLGRHRDGKYLIVTFGSPVVGRSSDARE
jgi:hypothetical protein